MHKSENTCLNFSSFRHVWFRKLAMLKIGDVKSQKMKIGDFKSQNLC